MNLIYLRHFCYDFRTYFAYDFAVHHAGKIVRKYRFSVVYPVWSENILVCYVRFEVGRQFAAAEIMGELQAYFIKYSKECCTSSGEPSG